MKKVTKKLDLKPETLRNLARVDLSKVNGGFSIAECPSYDYFYPCKRW